MPSFSLLYRAAFDGASGADCAVHVDSNAFSSRCRLRPKRNLTSFLLSYSEEIQRKLRPDTAECPAGHDAGLRTPRTLKSKRNKQTSLFMQKWKINNHYNYNSNKGIGVLPLLLSTLSVYAFACEICFKFVLLLPGLVVECPVNPGAADEIYWNVTGIYISIKLSIDALQVGLLATRQQHPACKVVGTLHRSR